MTVTEDFLEHYGIKGMKWGVRRAQKRAAKADARWQDNIYSIRGAVAVHNKVADKMNNGGLDALNNQPKYKNTKLLDFETGEPIGKIGKQNMKDYEKLTERFSKEAVTEVHGTSPSGGFKARLDTSDASQWKVVVEANDVQHAALELPPAFIFEVGHSNYGMITSASKIDDTLAQSNSFLEHYGIKGMKWGVRRRRGANGKVSKSPEAQKLESTVRKAKKKGVRSLTNKEIADFNKRAELEGKFVKANPSRAAKVEAGAKAVVAMVGLTSSLIGIANTPSGKAAIAAGQKAMSKKTVVTKMATTTVKSLPSDAFIG